MHLLDISPEQAGWYAMHVRDRYYHNSEELSNLQIVTLHLLSAGPVVLAYFT